MDTYPIPARSLERYFKVDGRTLERDYKDHLSGYRDWEQREHAVDWVLIADNLGERLCLDETMFCNDMVTILSNRDAHCGKGSIVAAVQGTKVEDVVKVLEKIPFEERQKVKEITMDFSDSMRGIAQKAFPNARITIDKFHVIKLAIEAIEEVRLKYKRMAVAERKQHDVELRKKLSRLKKQRKRYRKLHPKTYKGKKRGRKPQTLEILNRTLTVENGDSHVELLTRSKYLLSQSGEKWTIKQRQRARILFEKYPKIREAYSLICSLRHVFSDHFLTRNQAKERIHNWYKVIAESTLRETKSVRETIKAREADVLNFFESHLTNASAESLNSKIKGFRTLVRGVRDLPFFMYRVATIFG